MEPEDYKVKILHYRNPHLIWVLVKTDNKFHFEQIGIYGIQPVRVELDYDGNLETIRTDEWMPAILMAMKRMLLEAKDVRFSVNFLDKTTSIFDDNLHKFGDLQIKQSNGKTVSMLEVLLNSGLAVEDVGNFQSNLRTKLDYVQMVMTINKIKEAFLSIDIPMKELEAVFQSQMSIFEKTVQLQNDTKSRNLDIGHRSNHAALLKNQINDLNACKDTDEVSAGRACNVKTVKSVRSSALMKKLDIIKTQGKTSELNSPIQINEEVVHDKSLDINQNEEKLVSRNEQQPPAPWIAKSTKAGKKPPPTTKNKEKKFIAIGPCGLSTNKYVLKEVTEKEEKPREVKKIYNIESEDYENKQDMFEKTDSEVNFKISNVLNLKSPMKKYEYLNASNTSDENIKKDKEDSKPPIENQPRKLSSLYRKLEILREKTIKFNDSSSTIETDSATRQGDDSDSESITDLVEKLDVSRDSIKKKVKQQPDIVMGKVKNNVNPFKNLDSSKSVFVEKLVSPSVMVHTKHGNCIQPVSILRDIPFGTNIQVVLRNMLIKKPMRPQTVSWPTILRGYSLFLVSPSEGGKTMGYIPAVCRLVNDAKNMSGLSISLLTCIIVCATSNSVCYVQDLCKMFLHDANVFACYAGMTDIDITTTILNGVDILICTPCLLVRLMTENLGLDMRNLTTFVIDDCERISEVYQNELKICILKVKEMLKSRGNKELKVQYVVTSRIWCKFMSSLAKKAPDSVVCIGAFQECVLYAEANTSVEFLSKEKKLDAVINFLKTVDGSKKTVIACRTDDEVHLIEKALSSLNYVVFACDSTMNVHDLYSIDLALSEYKEPLLGPILVCCDGNLTHLNLTDAHYLIHYSLPGLFSSFCKRFAVLIDNYPSIFDKKVSDIKIKVFLENDNVEQLPKILHFIKRCSNNVSESLNEISSKVMMEKDLSKALSFVPICNLLLTSGKCPDIWSCKQRHAIFQDFDQPKDWVPSKGIVTFKILHLHTPVDYSVRMISCINENGVKKYPQTYSMLSIKLGMYYSKEMNRKLHGIAKPGDKCAVALKNNLFARCQVIKILQYTRNNHPSILLINLIDEEKYERAHDTSLYYLPDDLKKIDTHVAKVILTNLIPQDKDVTYSRLVEDQLKNILDRNEDLYMRGQVSLAIGNCIFVETLEACQDLSSLNETVVKNDFKKELLDGFAIENPGHIKALEKLCDHLPSIKKKEDKTVSVVVRKPIKILPKARWAHLESDSHTPIYYLYAQSPELLFVQHFKFRDCLNHLLKDIKKYVSDNPEPVDDVQVGDIVLAEFPDDVAYERARIDELIDGNKVKCFFVDLGDWQIVSIDKLLSITEKMITQLPFQAIECRLVGIKPLGNQWSEFSTNWLVDQFYNSNADLKYLFAKRCTTEKAEITGGDKYGIALIDTYADDVCINKLMLDANLAEENDEVDLLNSLAIEKEKKGSSDDVNSEEDDLEDKPTASKTPNSKNETTDLNDVCLEPSAQNQIVPRNSFQSQKTMDDTISSTSSEASANVPTNQPSIMNILSKVPLRSIPLVDDDEDIDDDKWDSPNAALMFLNKTKLTEEINEPKIIPLDHNDTKAITGSTIKEKTQLNAQSLGMNTAKIAELYSVPSTSKTTSDEIKNVNPISSATINDDTKDANLSSKTKINLQKWSVSVNANEILLADSVKKCQITWSQNSKSVTIEIEIITSEYQVVVADKYVQFYTNAINGEYGFEFELYGVIDTENSSHSNKGTYIEVILSKVMGTKWLTLYKGNINKWVPSDAIKPVLDDNKRKEIPDDQNKVSAPPKITAPVVTKVDDPKINIPTYKVLDMNENNEIDKLRKPKLVWRQNKNKVIVKIQLIADKYDIKINDKHIKFHAYANDEEYGFEFDLYGVVDATKSSHSNKGQYIQVNLTKVMAKNWLVLSMGHIKKWIVYDVDNIYVSSEDEEDVKDDQIEALKKNINFDQNSDSDDELHDDTTFKYKIHL